MEVFVGVMLDDLYRVETTSEKNVCVYKLVELDNDDGKLIAALVHRSLCHYPETLHINIHETNLSYIQNLRKYCNSYRCRKCGDSLCYKTRGRFTDTSARVRGPYVEYIRVACTTVWTMRKFESPNHCATTQSHFWLGVLFLYHTTSIGQ